MSDELEPIPFDDTPIEIEPGDATTSPAADTSAPAATPAAAAPRQTTITGNGATRIKSFHAKLRHDSLEYLDTQINEWLQNNPDCEVKFVSTTIGPLTGKTVEEAMFVNLWL
jgi:hypothetical protein